MHQLPSQEEIEETLDLLAEYDKQVRRYQLWLLCPRGDFFCIDCSLNVTPRFVNFDDCYECIKCKRVLFTVQQLENHAKPRIA